MTTTEEILETISNTEKRLKRLKEQLKKVCEHKHTKTERFDCFHGNKWKRVSCIICNIVLEEYKLES